MYYQSTLPEKDTLLIPEIKSVLDQNPYYGYKRISWSLGINHKRVYRIMKTYDIWGKRRVKIPKKKKDQGNPSLNIPNLIKDVVPATPNHIWCSDFTYLRYKSHFLYLSTTIDVYTKEIVGYRVSTRHTKQLIFETISSALQKHGKPTIHHSDQESEYASYLIQDYLKHESIKQSVSTRSSPWQNGYQESFYGKFKQELESLNNCQSLGEAITQIATQIRYYNTKRLHTAHRMTSTQKRKEYYESIRVKSLENVV
jgi:putative transposase